MTPETKNNCNDICGYCGYCRFEHGPEMQCISADPTLQGYTFVRKIDKAADELTVFKERLKMEISKYEPTTTSGALFVDGYNRAKTRLLILIDETV